MKKIFKLFFSAVTVLSICLATLPINAFAAGNASISFSKQNPSVGDTITATIKILSDSMYGINISGSYNEEVLTYVSGASEGGAGLFKIADSESFNGESSKSFTLTFKANKSGSSSISVKGQVASGIPPVDIDVAASATISVSDASKSTNANLSSLRTSAGVLSPKFSASVTEYTVNVGSNTTECKVYGTTADPDADISVSGSATLKIGENKRVVTVTAPSGDTKSYTLTIIRSETDDTDSSENTSGTGEIPSALETVVDGVSYMVLKDISGIKLPNGFTASERLYNNETISVAMDEKGLFEIFYLKSADSDTAYPYTYDQEKNAFKRLQIITQMDKEYIVAELPENCSLPENYISANVKIGDMSVECYSNTEEQSADMFYIYCYYNGEFGMYRYDKLENVLQRYPELRVIESDVEAVSGNGFLDRFKSLSSNAKTIVVCLFIAVLGVIALVVLLIVKLVKSTKVSDYDLLEDDEDFESVTLDENYEIVDGHIHADESEEEPEDDEK